MSKLLSELRERRPLVHCMTNIVVANFQANGLLSLGASPVMADAPEEAGEMAAAASCTVLNIGTLHRESLEAMEMAGKAANGAGNPVVLDPVGAGATQFRRDAISRLLGAVDVTLIRCNAGELAAIADVDWRASGVDAGEGEMDVESVAAQVAHQYRCLVAVTGETDVLTDGERIVRISGGHPVMSRITGAGCLLSAVCGAFLAVDKEDSFRSVAEALAFYKAAGERAAETSSLPGSFLPAFIDRLAVLGDGDFKVPEPTEEVRA